MSDITLTYTYDIPDEQFIDSFKGKKTTTFTYNGPEILKVTVPENGAAYTQKLDGPVYDGEIIIDIDLSKQPELAGYADLLYGRPYDYIATFETTILSDGTEYIEHNNKMIHDYYYKPSYNFETNTFNKPVLIIRDTLTPAMRDFLAKADMFIEILSGFELSIDDNNILTTFIKTVEDYRSITTTPWKYPDTNPYDREIPKIPMILVNNVKIIKDLTKNI